MSSTLARPASAEGAVHPTVAPCRRTRIFVLPEARWAAAALVLSLAGLPLYLLGAPAWSGGPLFALTHATGGWEPGWARRISAEDEADVPALIAARASAAW